MVRHLKQLTEVQERGVMHHPHENLIRVHPPHYVQETLHLQDADYINKVKVRNLELLFQCVFNQISFRSELQVVNLHLHEFSHIQMLKS